MAAATRLFFSADKMIHRSTGRSRHRGNARSRAGTMNGAEIGCLINSIARFIHLVSCQTARNAPIVKYMNKTVAGLKHLKPVLDKAMDSSAFMSGYSQELVGLFEELNEFVDQAREVVERHAQRMSITCCVLLCEPLEIKIMNSSMEICRILKELLQPDPLNHMYASIERCIQGLECCREGSAPSKVIVHYLKDQSEYSIFSPDDMISIAESLGLKSKELLFKERIALEKDKAKIEGELAMATEQLIEMVKRIGLSLDKREQKDGHLDIPPYYRCPLSSELMLDPVILASGQTFERSFVQKWLESGLRFCPVTRQALSHTNLVPNYTVKVLVANWCEEKGLKSGPFPALSIEEGSGCKMPYGHIRSESASSTSSAFDDKVISARPAVMMAPSSSPWSLGTGGNLSSHREDGGRTPSCSTGCGGWDEPAEYSVVERLVEDLQGEGSGRAEAVLDVRLLARNNRENRLMIGQCGGIVPLVAILHNLGNEEREAEADGSGSHEEMEENTVTALLNLSIEETNKRVIVAAGGVESLVQVLQYGRSAAARENTAAALASLASVEEHKSIIGRCAGAIRGLVELLGGAHGTTRGNKDAVTALFSLSIAQENRARIVQAGAVRRLLWFLGDGGEENGAHGMVDKAAALLANLATTEEGRAGIVKEGGISLLVEVVEMGSPKGKENAAAALLQLCLSSQSRCAMVLQEGAVPPLITLSQLGTPRAREKAQQILSQFRCQRQAGNFARRRP